MSKSEEGPLGPYPESAEMIEGFGPHLAYARGWNVDPEVEPSHGALVVYWLRRAFRAALPFTAGVATADPEGLASAAAAVDVRGLGAA